MNFAFLLDRDFNSVFILFVIKMAEKIAVIGVGGWGQNHARVVAILRSIDLIKDVVVMDINKKRAKLIAKLYGHSWTTNFDNVLHDEDIDGVIISSPTKIHYIQTKQALEAGKHVLVEKPMTETFSQAKELVEIARENNRILMTGFLLRYSPAVQFVKKMYTENKLGHVLVVYSKRTNPWPARKYDVGVVRDLAIHDIDLSRFIFSAKPKKAFAYGGKLKHDYEDFANIFLEFISKNNDIFQTIIETSWVTPYKFRRLEITTTECVVSLDLVEHTVTIFRSTGIFTPRLEKKEPLLEEDKNFVLAIDGKEKPLVTGEDGAIALMVCEKILSSMETKDVVTIPEINFL